MTDFEYAGKRYPLVEPDDWMLSETREVDHWIGGQLGYADSGLLTRYACLAAVSIARIEQATSITAWLNMNTNRTVAGIVQQLEDAAEAEQAGDEVLSPTNAGSGPSWPPAEPSSTSSKPSGGSRRSSATSSTPGAGTA